MKKLNLLNIAIKIGILLVLIMNVQLMLKAHGADLSTTDVTLNIGDITTVTVFDDVDGYWVSDKPNVATVEDGVIKGLSAGDAIISYVEYGDIRTDVKVTVVDNKVLPKFKEYIISETSKEENSLRPGKYVIVADRGKFGNYTISYTDSNMGYMSSANILTNNIVDLEDGSKLNVENCSVYSLESIKLNTSSSGSFIVGQHISAGTYVIETDNCDVGQYILYKNVDKNEILESYHIKQDTPYTVRLYDGEYIELNGLKLSLIHI